MKKLRNHLIGVDQGDIALFSDFEEGGEMWTGTGPRERRRIVRFSEPYRRPPSVSVSVSLWDVDTKGAIRVDVSAQAVTKDSFAAVVKTSQERARRAPRHRWSVPAVQRFVCVCGSD